MNKKFALPKIKNELYLGILILMLKVYGEASSILPFYNDNFDTMLAMLGIACLFSHCLRMRYYRKKEFFYYVLFSILALSSILLVGNYNIFITVVTCLAIRGEKTEDVINFIFRYASLFFGLHLLYALLRIPLTGDTYAKIINGVVRYDMGFGHPNRFSILLFNLLLMWIWLHFSEINYTGLAVIFIISLINYSITRTRTNEIAIAILLMILALYRRFPKKISLLLRWLAMTIVPMLSFLSMMMVMLYQKGKNVFAVSLDTILSGRIRLGAYAYEHYGLSLFGKNLTDVKIQYDAVYGLNAFTFDNIYTDILMRQGAIWLLVIAVLFYRLARKRNDSFNFAIVAWGIYGITEVHGLNVYMLFVILLVNELFENSRHVEMECREREGVQKSI